MKRLIFPIGAATLLLFGLADDATAAERVALVVGNGAYQHTPSLANPTHDAEDVAKRLREVGFDVIVGTDLSRKALYDKVKGFGDASDRADVSLFYYSGHGMQMDGKNYLVPVDAALAHELDVSQQMVALDAVMSQMGGTTNLVFLDACRNNPLAKPLATAMGISRAVAANRGLAKVTVAGEALIAFATEPGGVAADGAGRNSPFTTALLQHMGEPGLSINDLLTRVNGAVRSATKNSQVPWHHASLARIFRFVDDVGDGKQLVPVPRPVPVARQALVRSIQVDLNAMGFTAGQADGEFRQQTRGALSAFLSVRGLGDSGLSENVQHASQARREGYKNFMGCVTERKPVTARVSRQVPRTITEWVDESETLTYRAQDACNLITLCGYHFDQYGRMIPNYGPRCDQACTISSQSALQAGMAYPIEMDLRQECEKSSRDDDGRNPSLEGFLLHSCKCPSGSLCHCDFEATCEYKVQEESTEYETRWEENTVFEEEEVCRCRAPEVAVEDCVRAG